MGILNRAGFLLGNMVKDLIPEEKVQGAKILVSNGDGVDELLPGVEERRKHVRFPVSLAVRHGEEVPLMSQDYVLNASEGGVFIQCDNPFPPETILILHFFLPPNERLLAKFTGEVTDVSDGSSFAKGMHVKFFNYDDRDMELFLSFLEGNKQLLDIKT